MFLGEPPATVLVVDDDISVRESLESLIRNEGWRPQLFDSARAFFERPAGDSPRCLVLDVGLPDLNGLELQRSIAAEQAFMPIIFITGYGDIPMTVRAMKAGAVDFLAKPFRDQDLLDAVAAAVEADKKRRSEEGLVDGLAERYASLSEREKQVMGLATAGLMNKQIAFELGLSEVTVKIHRGRVMKKMQAQTFAQLVRSAVALGVKRT